MIEESKIEGCIPRAIAALKGAESSTKVDDAIARLKELSDLAEVHISDLKNGRVMGRNLLTNDNKHKLSHLLKVAMRGDEGENNS